MSIQFGEQTFWLNVATGSGGVERFKADVRRLLGLSAHDEFDITFECTVPLDGAFACCCCCLAVRRKGGGCTRLPGGLLSNSPENRPRFRCRQLQPGLRCRVAHVAELTACLFTGPCTRRQQARAARAASV
jgi:hypothetical protein